MKLNSITLVGHMTDNVRFTEGTGDVSDRAWFVLGVNRKRQKDKSDFIPVICWGKQAKAMLDYTQKGQELTVMGELHSRRVENEDGSVNYHTEVSAEYISFGQKSKKQQTQGAEGADAPAAGNDDVATRAAKAAVAAYIAAQQAQTGDSAAATAGAAADDDNPFEA